MPIFHSHSAHPSQNRKYFLRKIHSFWNFWPMLSIITNFSFQFLLSFLFNFFNLNLFRPKSKVKTPCYSFLLESKYLLFVFSSCSFSFLRDHQKENDSCSLLYCRIFFDYSILLRSVRCISRRYLKL